VIISLSGRRLGLAVGVWLATSLIGGGVTAFVWRLAATPDVNALSVVIVFEVYALLIASLYLVLGRRDGALMFLAVRPTSIANVALACAVGATFWGLAAVAYIATGRLGALRAAVVWIGTDGGRLGTLGPITTSLSLLRACLLAPIGEELLFRGALFAWLRPRTSAWSTFVLTAAMFAAIHFQPILMPISFVSGVVLGWIRERTESTLPGIVFHVGHNVAIVAVVYLLTGR
jgi:membrane protease YdiL (CAAX protease family)